MPELQFPSSSPSSLSSPSSRLSMEYLGRTDFLVAIGSLNLLFLFNLEFIEGEEL